MLENEAEDDQPSTTENKRFILQVPPDVNFRGDPPHWARQLFLEPLVDGWKREIVIRTTPIKNKKADIYYFAPDGTKFRSRREIGQYLQDKGITKYSPVFNFWFNGKILGAEFAPYEVVRRSLPLAKRVESCFSNAQAVPADIISDEESNSSDSVAASQDSQLEEGMVYDEEIEIDSGQIAIFDPAVLKSLGDPTLPIALPVVKEKQMSNMVTVYYECGRQPRRASIVYGKPKVHTALPAVKEQRTPINPPKKRKMSHQEPMAIETKTERRYCICDDIEHGQMVFCDNTNCEIGWYHFKCVNIQKSPPGSWFCPICRGPTSDVLNPAYGVKRELYR